VQTRAQANCSRSAWRPLKQDIAFARRAQQQPMIKLTVLLGQRNNNRLLASSPASANQTASQPAAAAATGSRSCFSKLNTGRAFQLQIGS